MSTRFCLGILLCASSGIALHVSAQQSTRSSSNRRIDGAPTPDAIPDETAFLMFFRSIADEPSAPPYNVRVDSVRRAGLNGSEAAQVIAVAGELSARLSAMEAAQTTNAANPEYVTKLRRQRDSIVRESVSTVSLRLSPESAAKLRRFVNEHVKRRIRIVL